MDEWPIDKKQRVFEVIRTLQLPEGGIALDFGCALVFLLMFYHKHSQNGRFMVVISARMPLRRQRIDFLSVHSLFLTMNEVLI